MALTQHWLLMVSLVTNPTNGVIDYLSYDDGGRETVDNDSEQGIAVDFGTSDGVNRDVFEGSSKTDSDLIDLRGTDGVIDIMIAANRRLARRSRSTSAAMSTLTRTALTFCMCPSLMLPTMQSPATATCWSMLKPFMVTEGHPWPGKLRP